MESVSKNKGKNSLLMSLKSVVGGVNDSFTPAMRLHFKGGDPVLAYLAVANKDGVVLPAMLSSTVMMAEDNGGNCPRKKRRNRWQTLKAALNETTLMRKIIGRRKKKKDNLPLSKSTNNSEGEVQVSNKISNPKRKTTCHTNSTASSTIGFLAGVNSSTSLSSSSSSSVDRVSGTSFHETSLLVSSNGTAVTKQKQCGVEDRKKGHYGSNSSPCMFLISLLVLIMWGKSFAILCTSIWFYVMRPSRGRPCNEGALRGESEYD